MRGTILFASLFVIPLTAADLRVDVPVVQVNVNVTDPVGGPVLGLDRANFRLLEDGVEQNISYFASEDAPVSVALLFDASGSMQKKMRTAQRAITELFKASNPEDEFALVVFNNRARVAVPFTTDTDNIQDRLWNVRPNGRTTLLDAIHLALAQMKHARYSRKAIVVISDGGDNHSRYSEGEIRDQMREANVQLYAIGIFGPLDAHLPPEEANGPELLQSLSTDAGGQYFPVENLAELPDACIQIGRILRNQYLLTYTPTHEERDGKYRHLKVIVNYEGPRLRVDHRKGYYAPQD